MPRNYDFKFVARGAAYILCCEVVDRITRLFGISTDDALEHVNEHWGELIMEDGDIVLHETADHWAALIVLGNLWWEKPEYAALVADLKGLALAGEPSRLPRDLPGSANFRTSQLTATAPETRASDRRACDRLHGPLRSEVPHLQGLVER